MQNFEKSFTQHIRDRIEGGVDKKIPGQINEKKPANAEIRSTRSKRKRNTRGAVVAAAIVGTGVLSVEAEAEQKNTVAGQSEQAGVEQAGVMESQEGISRKGHVYEFPPVQTRVIKGQGERDGEEPKRIKDYIAGESGFPGERPRGALGRLIEGHQDSGLKEIKPEGPSPDLSEIKPAKPKKGKSKE